MVFIYFYFKYRAIFYIKKKSLIIQQRVYKINAERVT